MLKLITGLPGSYKSTYFVQTLAETCQRTEGHDGHRSIYACNVKGLRVDDPAFCGRVELLDDPNEWESLPDGSIIFIDEVQQFWRKRGPSKPCPPAVEHMDTHRHRGFDFVMVTQTPMLVDVELRAFIQEHHHFHRPFGLPFASVYRFEVCETEPVKAGRTASSGVVVGKYTPKRWAWKLYKSSTIHTVKMRPPWKLVAVGVSLIGALFVVVPSAFGMYEKLFGETRFHGKTVAPQATDAKGTGGALGAMVAAQATPMPTVSVPTPAGSIVAPIEQALAAFRPFGFLDRTDIDPVAFFRDRVVRLLGQVSDGEHERCSVEVDGESWTCDELQESGFELRYRVGRVEAYASGKRVFVATFRPLPPVARPGADDPLQRGAQAAKRGFS